jgi:hypothetical protein
MKPLVIRLSHRHSSSITSLVLLAAAWSAGAPITRGEEPPVAGLPATAAATFVPGEMIVQFKQDATDAQVAEAFRQGRSS